MTRSLQELSLLGLKELNLSACNLSAIPDGIGLLYSLKELDLSENNFITLPASISLLSNLRMLCLNSCTRLESLPKLSKINEDTLCGLEIRFRHYISGEGLDVSKFRLSSLDFNPTVSCLNCPKLIENRSGSGLTDTVLKKYLQVRTESKVIPDAIFEIFAAGSEIPEWFKLERSHFMILKGKYWRIPVPINFLEAELETQLVWYWTVTDDLRTTVHPSQMNQIEISFYVDPEDGNLEVKKFGFRFLCREDILKLRGPRFSSNGIPSFMKMLSLFRCQKMRWYNVVCEDNQELQSFISSFQDHTCKVITILTSGFTHGSISLDSLREVIESLLEMNQEVVKVILECKEEIWKDGQIFSFVSQFFKFSLPMLDLCTCFMKFLKASGDSCENKQESTRNHLKLMEDIMRKTLVSFHQEAYYRS